jgi:uncharacterized protein (TIGR00255 family)
MIHSMTGYASVSRDVGRGFLFLELRSVNARFLDIGFRTAEEVRAVEPQMRELFASRMSRGKLECRTNLLAAPGVASGLRPSEAVLVQLAGWQEQIRQAIPGAQALRVADVLRWPGIFGDDARAAESLQAHCLELAREALDELIASRAREGDKLGRMIMDRVREMRALVAEVAPRLPAVIAEYQERLAARLREVLANQDEERIRQEIGLFAARIDVAEEVSRLKTHLTEVERVLEKGGVVGKRLDFLMQELNREANTVASKSMSVDVTRIALDLKLLIEQMREQVQNIE